MEMKKSDIFDRWTILRMKIRYDEGASLEFHRFSDEIDGIFLVARHDATMLLGLFRATCSLMEANASIWQNEAAIRKEYENDPSSGGKILDYAEIGRRAVLIRELNKIRCDAKQEIDKLFNQTPDVKVDHVSQ